MQNNIEIREQIDSSTEDTAYVCRKFKEFNDKNTGIHPSKELLLVAYGSDEKVIGGLFGDISWGWMHVDVLWVDEAHRNNRIGSSLMDRAEAEAKAMGVTKAYIETTDFQAVEFYEKRGYKVFARIDNQPPGHACYYMQRTDF
ncbi:acetyltransferase, GNAT family [Verrucomicrobiia bacterium DG1235]|nr:acetyltransferase, GNAT family [Verrucomicrobiae bacterium DG1235]